MRIVKILLIAISLLLSQITINAQDFEVNGIFYNYITDRTVEVTYKGRYSNSYSNEYSGDVIIPSTVTFEGNTYDVVSIADYAFRYCSTLKSITIPSSITSIGIPSPTDATGGCSFNCCDALTAVHISDLAAWCKIKFGGAYANPLYYAKNLYLNGKKVTDLIIPEEITEVKEYAFICSSIKSVLIHKNVTCIKKNAFCYCKSLENITIGSGVKNIANWAFGWCTKLESVTSKINANDLYIIETETFYKKPDNTTLYVQSDAITQYKTTNGWNVFKKYSHYDYIVKYIIDGLEYKSFTVDYGEEIPIAETPIKEGYTFSGWNEVPKTMPANDITITGNFTLDSTSIDKVENENEVQINTYDINGNLVNKTEKIGYGIYIVNGKKVLVK